MMHSQVFRSDPRKKRATTKVIIREAAKSDSRIVPTLYIFLAVF